MFGQETLAKGRMRGLKLLTERELPQAVELLSRAFEGDPFVEWVVRSDARHDDGMRRFFEVCLKQLTLPSGEVWVTTDLSGIALWVHPAGFSVGISQQLHFIGQAIRGMGLRNVPSRLAGFNEIERHHPDRPHYYLFFLGVDPQRQGEGIGSRLTEHMLRRCDAERMSAYLEATRSDLIPFYARFGYRLLQPFALTHDGPVLQPMWREPQPPTEPTASML